MLQRLLQLGLRLSVLSNSAFTFHSLQLRLSASAWSEQVWQSHWSGCRWVSLQGRGPLWTAPRHRTAKNWCAASPPLVAALKKWRGSLSAANTLNQANTSHLVQLSRPIILLPSYIYRFLTKYNFASVTQTYSCVLAAACFIICVYVDLLPSKCFTTCLLRLLTQ